MTAPTTLAPRPPPAGQRRRRWPWVMLVLVVALPIVGAGSYWYRGRSTRSEGELLPIPAGATGPGAAASTRAYDGELDEPPAPWGVARTGADDRQLIVSFAGGGCGTFHPAVRESDEAVEVTIRMVWPGGDVGCNAMAMEQSIGIALDAPLGDRELGGGAIDDPVVVPGSELVSMDWPGDADRASTESLHPDPTTPTFTWTQRFDPTAGALAESIILTQERGPSIDDGALAAGCQSATGLRATAVDLRGDAATLVECPNGTLAVWWMLDGDRVSLVAAPDAPVDPTSIVDLARTVRRGG